MSNDRSSGEYRPQRYRHRRTEVEGIIYDGSVDCARAIVDWGRRRTGGQPFEIAGDDLHALTRQGVRYVPENDLATLGVLKEPYSIDPAVLAVAYEFVNGNDYRAPLTLARVLELVEEAKTAGADRLRQIVGELGAHCEVLQGG